jgi:hypothetical protein
MFINNKIEFFPKLNNSFSDKLKEERASRSSQTSSIVWSNVFFKTRILFKRTLNNSFAQAIIRLFDTNYISLKLFWFVCLLGCVSLCCYLMIQALISYLSNSVYTTTTIVHEIPAVFPKVTICNSASATTEYAYEMVKQINDEFSPDISIFNQSQISQLSLEEQENTYWKIYNIFQARINGGACCSDDLSRQKLVYPFDDVLVYCYFNFQRCNASDFVWRWDPLYGNCYVFNSGKGF